MDSAESGVYPPLDSLLSTLAPTRAAATAMSATSSMAIRRRFTRVRASEARRPVTGAGAGPSPVSGWAWMVVDMASSCRCR